MDPVFFLHIPKTAGTSVNDFLAGLYAPAASAQHIELHRDWHSPDFWPKYQFVSGHINYIDARLLVPKNFRFVTFLRDPWPHLLSVIRYQYAVGASTTRELFSYVDPALRSFCETLQDVDLMNPREFEQWLSAALKDNKYGYLLLDNMQTRFMSKPDQNKRVDAADLTDAIGNLTTIVVGIVEHIDVSRRHICQVLGVRDCIKPDITLNERLVELKELDTPQIKEICESLIKFDQQLYNFGLRLLKDRVDYLERQCSP